MVFEELFEPNLQLDKEEKQRIIEKGIAVWLYVNGVLAGEIYGATLESLGEQIEDTEKETLDTVYCYSTAVLPHFQGEGFSKILKAFWLGMVVERGYKCVVGHATTAIALHLNELFGATRGAWHEDWYDTDRTATYYRIELTLSP
jgi:GNAT superfamily N-acetyltransferase